MTSTVLSIVVFSKDRACQLDSLLRSLRDHLRCGGFSVSVLYKPSGAEFEKGYARCREREILPGVEWREERSFRDDVIAIVKSSPHGGRVMFLVDDDVLFRPFDPAPIFAAMTPRHLFMSLRCGRGRGDRDPRFLRSEPYLEWWWYGASSRGCWRYPFSVDGNVFQRDFLLSLTEKISFCGPNSFESALHARRHRPSVLLRTRALAPLAPVLFNNPLNRVQTEGETWHAGVSTSMLNEKYLSGMCIDNGPLYRANPDAMHFSLPAALVPREG
jgi:hypothetical protein